MMNENLKCFIEKSLESLEYIKKHEPQEFTWNFECSLLDPKYLTLGLAQFKIYSKELSFIQDIKGPTVYWFEITSDVNPLEIINAMQNYAKEDNHRIVPVIGKKDNITSNCLYVGKVKKNFYARVKQHLGYYSTKATQGLQLCHWARNLSLNLRLHYIEFEDDMADMMPVIEQYFAIVLKPLIGKHI